MGDRCTGRCCRGFSLPYSPTGLASRAAAGGIEDGEQIAAMVIPLGESPTLPGHWRYDCRNLLPSGDCAVYESRPRMCSRYPYGRHCIHGDECEWDDARLGRVREGGRRCLPMWQPYHREQDTPQGTRTEA